MGASGWDYAVGYRPEVAVALRELQDDVFRRGDYYPNSISPDYAAAMGITAPDTRPESIDALLEMQEEEGTHSILDMCRGISDAPSFLTLSPLDDLQLQENFGTTTPGADDVQAWMKSGDYAEVRDRWMGVYVISYVDGQPDQIHFGGFSGD